jgi:hypothetical protein
VRVLAGADIAALLGFERQRQLLGYEESGCLAEIGWALGAHYLAPEDRAARAASGRG